MEEEAAHADEKVSNEGNKKNGIMAMLNATPDASVSEIDEEEVRQRVDKLRQVESSIIVLHLISFLQG